MDTLLGIYHWSVAHWDQILLAITSVVTTASVIARLTPSDKDDAFIARIANFLALNKKK